MAMRPLAEVHRITQRFAQDLTQYNAGARHGAVDIGAPIGSKLVAPEDGVVVFDGWAWDLPGGPNDWLARFYQIKPARGDTKTGGGILTIFRNAAGSHWIIAHANRSFFKVGDRIRKGTIIQDTGTTGSSTGPHSHIALLPANPDYSNGAFGGIDPEPYFEEPYRPLGAVAVQTTTTTAKGVGSSAGAVVNFVDVSEHNSVDSVRKVATDALIVRTGWGIGGDDKLAAQHFATAKARGLRVGTYHYAYLNLNDPAAEARYYAGRIPAEAEFGCLDYEHGLTDGVPVSPEKAAAFAREFRKHSKKPLYLYTWGWVAEKLDASLFDGLWLPDFGTNPVLTGYAPAVVFPPVKGWTVVANQYGDHFRPATGGEFDINKHMGGLWPVSATEGGPLMVTKEDEQKIEKIVQNAIRGARFKGHGDEKDTTLEAFLSWNLFRIREEESRIHRKLDTALECVRPSNLTAVLASTVPPGADVDIDELAQKIGAALLAHITTATNTEGA